MKAEIETKIFPFGITALIIILDQISKALIARFIEENTIGAEFFGEFLRIVHVRNTGIAFSIGRGLPENFRRMLFIIAPLIVVAVLLVYYFRSSSLSQLQRLCIAGIAGGGIGNNIDRIFRGGRVIDFIDVKFYDIFGLERWPVFNIADSSVVIFGILLLISVIIEDIRGHREEKSPHNQEHNNEQEG